MTENPLDSGGKFGKNGGLMRPKGLKGHCLHMLKHMDHGLLALLAMLVVVSPVWAAKTDLVPVRAALESGDCDKALSLLQPVMAGGEQSGEAFYLLGAIHVGKQNWTEAEAALSEAVNKKRYNEIEALLAYGHALIGTKKSGEVAALIEKPLAKTKDPKKAAALKHVLGLAEMANGNYSKAQEWLLGARVDDEDNLAYREALGDAYYAGQIYPLALGEYEAVMAADSSRIDLMFRVAQAYYQQRRLTEARPLLLDVLKRDSTFDEAYYLLANIYMIGAQSKSGGDPVTQYRNALSLYRKVRDVDPDANPVLVAKNIAKVYYLLNAHDSAIVELQNAINTGATDPELYFYLGRSNRLLGNHQAAIEAFQKYRELREAEVPPYQWTKEDADLFLQMAASMEALKDTSLAQQIAENRRRASDLDPENPTSISGLAMALYNAGRYPEAAVEFEKLVQISPSDARVLFNSSLPYLKMQNNARAVELLLKAAEFDTSADDSYRGKAYKISGPILVNLGRAAEAQKAYKWLMDHEPGVCDHLQWYGFTYFGQKQYQPAIPHLKRAYDCFEKKAPGGCGHNELRWWLAYATYETATGDTQKDESYQLCKQVIKCNPNHKDAKLLMDRIDEEIEEVGSN